MATTQYIGARYVPLFADPLEWSNTKTYEPLTIVLHQGNSYTSRQYVPLGVDISNEEFWALTGNYNAQVEMYRRETAAAQQSANEAQQSADAAQNDIDTLLPKTAFSENNTVKDYIDSSVLALENKTLLSITPTKIYDLPIPSGYYAQGMTIANDVIYVFFASSSSGNPRIYKYDFSSGSLLAYKEYSSSDVGHGNSLTFEPTSSQLVTIGPSNNSLAYIDMDTLDFIGSHSLTTPYSEFCINANGTNAFAIGTGRRVGMQYFKDTIDNYYIAKNTVPLYMNDLIGQDISFSRGANNFVAGVFLRNINGAHYNYIYQIDCHNGFSNRIYFIDVSPTTEIEGIEVYNNEQYIVDNAGGFYSVHISSDYRTNVLSLYQMLNINISNTLHTSTFNNGTNKFTIPIYFPIPYDVRDYMQGVPILFRSTGNNMQLMANNMGGAIRGFTITNDGVHHICLEYTTNSSNIAYLTRVRIDDTTQTFTGTDINAIASALDSYIAARNITTDIGLTMRGYGITPYGIANTAIPVSK